MKIYFIGIGGIGMSALARYFNNKGWGVYGYDKTETNLTKKLVKEGIEIHYLDDVSLLRRDVGLVVYTPAIQTDNKVLNWYKANGYELKKRAEVLGMISQESKALAIAGTHGKTTTSGMLSHILSFNGFDFTGFVGGLDIEKASNFVPGDSEWIVVEADEYDRSFLHLTPEVVGLMSLDADHLDIYGDEKGMIDGFREFTYKIKEGGRLFIREEDATVMGEEWRVELEEKNIEVLLLGEERDVVVRNLVYEDEWQYFDYKYKNWERSSVRMGMVGKYNVENGAVAISMALDLGVDEEGVYNAIRQFKGIKRRFEFVIRQEELVMIDDYAHHPTELEAVISAVNTMYPKKKILGVFQPHLYSRTLDFYPLFAKALDELGEVALLDIYPAREVPIEGVTSELILNEMRLRDKSIVDKGELLEFLKKRNFDVLLMLGAGDIGELVADIAAGIRKKLVKKN